jgi:Outer membrane protein and related peptidoglycan-associated (lipo)proteins
VCSKKLTISVLVGRIRIQYILKILHTKGELMLRYLLILSLVVTLSGCTRSSTQVLDDTRSCGRHVTRGMSSLCGKQGDSRQIRCKEDFYRRGENSGACDPYDMAMLDPDFIPLTDEEGNDLLCLNDAPASRYSPGESGSPVPALDQFSDPSKDPRLAPIFKPVHFEYNSNTVQGSANEAILQKIAQYLNQHPKMYVFIEGHCDERGPQAFNLALGTRRAQEVRSILISMGINSDRLFTVSYGKERPCLFGHDENSWSQNRRAEFKVYEN